MIKAKKIKNNEVRYLVRVKDRCGRWYPSRTFHRKVDAEKYERELKQKADLGDAASALESRKLTFTCFWERWRVQRSGRVSEGWRLSQDQMARDYILPVLGTMVVSGVRSQDIGRVLGEMEKLGRGLQTRRHVYNLLHKVFEDAKEYFELIGKNPVLRRDKPGVPQIERSFLKPEDAWKLLDASRSHFLGPAIWISILCGLRPSEIQALKWSSVDLDLKQITIREAYKRKVRRVEPYPKQGDWGIAQIPDALAEYLAKIKKAKSETELVAPGLKGRMLQYEVLLFGLKKLCRELGVTEITPHEMRHTCSEIWIRTGATSEDVKRQLNQSSLAVTERYLHRTHERLKSLGSMIRPLSIPESDPPPTQKLRLVS